MYVRLISWDCFTYSGNWNGLFVNLLVEINQVRKYLKFLIMSTSPRHVRDLSRPASRWHALDLVLVSLLLNFQEQFLVFTLLTLNKEILPGQDLKKFSVIAHLLCTVLGLTDFRPIFLLRINQVVGFYEQNVGKRLVEEWHIKVKIQAIDRSFLNILLLKTKYLVST